MRESCQNGKVRKGGGDWKETTKQGTESAGAYQEETKQGTETVNSEPTKRIAQKGKSKAEEADSQKAEASVKERNKTEQTQRENERVEGRIERKDAFAEAARRAISPGRGA